MAKLVTALVLASLFSGAVAAATPAEASSDCVTNREYRTVKSVWKLEGLPVSGVHHYFGFAGQQVSKGSGRMTRRYGSCDAGGNVVVRYRYVPSVGGKTWMAVGITRVGGTPIRLCTPSGRTAQYPFSFLLTTSLANTDNKAVRAAVRSVQTALRDLGIRATNGTRVIVDGSYGPQTASAVRRFQQQAGILVDGKVGSQTWARLGRRYC